MQARALPPPAQFHRLVMMPPVPAHSMVAEEAGDAGSWAEFTEQGHAKGRAVQESSEEV